MAHPKKQQSLIPQLAPYTRELPSPVELAMLAAILAPENYPAEAFRRAAKFYLQAAEFHEAYSKAVPTDRARLCGEYEISILAKFQSLAVQVPEPAKFPATHDDFLKLVVKAKTPADSYKRLRDFFRSECLPIHDPDEYAAQEIADLKSKGILRDEWNKLGATYLYWQRKQNAEQNRKNRKGKTKKHQ